MEMLVNGFLFIMLCCLIMTMFVVINKLDELLTYESDTSEKIVAGVGYGVCGAIIILSAIGALRTLWCMFMV